MANLGKADDALLDRAILSLKATVAVGAQDHLSPMIRAAVIEAAAIEASKHTTPARRPQKAWLIAGFGAVASMTLAVLFMGGAGELNRPLTIQAAKTGDEVVFTISNGHRAHRVIKSTDPERFGPGRVAVEDGRFHDLAESGPVLVFYRVD